MVSNQDENRRSDIQACTEYQIEQRLIICGNSFACTVYLTSSESTYVHNVSIMGVGSVLDFSNPNRSRIFHCREVLICKLILGHWRHER